jgi:hypothetical protein
MTAVCGLVQHDGLNALLAAAGATARRLGSDRLIQWGDAGLARLQAAQRVRGQRRRQFLRRELPDIGFKRWGLRGLQSSVHGIHSFKDSFRMNVFCWIKFIKNESLFELSQKPCA